MASIRKRGNSYLLVVSMGYTPDGRRRNPQQKTVKPPAGLTPKQTKKWLQEQAMLFEMSGRKLNPDIDRSITLEKYTEIWLQTIAPDKLAKSTLVREKQDIERFKPYLGSYKLVDLRPEHFRSLYAKLRKQKNKATGKPISEATVAVFVGDIHGEDRLTRFKGQDDVLPHPAFQILYIPVDIAGCSGELHNRRVAQVIAAPDAFHLIAGIGFDGIDTFDAGRDHAVALCQPVCVIDLGVESHRWRNVRYIPVRPAALRFPDIVSEYVSRAQNTRRELCKHSGYLLTVTDGHIKPAGRKIRPAGCAWSYFM